MAFRSQLESRYPGLRDSDWGITSEEDPRYNCIAFAAFDEDRWWEPDPMGQYFWPPSVPRENTLEAFILAFESVGYVRCEDETHEDGFHKVALYVKANAFTHAAREHKGALWKSKLGEDVDIVHRLDALSGRVLGRPAVFLKRSSSHPAYVPA